VAHRAAPDDPTPCLGLLPHKGGEESATKKIPATDAIGAQGAQSTHAAEAAADVVRLAMEAQATGKVGPGARGGPRRLPDEAADPACAPAATRTPVGLCLPTVDAWCVYGGTSQVTRDGRVDRLAPWWEAVRERFAPLPTLGITVENGPEHHRRRTQGRQRRVACVQPERVPLRRADSPPSHRQSKPLERCWGLLAKHGHGPVLDARDTGLPFARTMPWHGKPPRVALGTTT
jgi:Rhodopirellula transposase DDE domain